MMSRGAWRISCIYAGFGQAWIVLSSVLVWLRVGRAPDLASFLEMGKGTLFILVTTALLFVMLRHWENELNRRDEKVRRSEVRYRLLHESLRDGFVQIDLDGRFLDFNAVYSDMLGYRAEELLQRNFTDLTPERWHGPESAILKSQVMTRGYSDVYEKEYRRKDGTIIPVELRAILVRDDAGHPVSMYAIVRDISERRAQQARADALRDQLIHTGRVQELGQVSAGIAHELNQPLAAMQNYVGAAKRFAERGDGFAATEAITKAGEQATRAADIIQRMRGFLEKRGTEKKREDINALIREAAGLALIGARSAGIDTRYFLAGELPPVIADRVQIEQVLVNLLHNAIDAMTDSHERVLILSSRMGASAVEILVTDTGNGIPAEIAESLFQPFVTTKKSGMGIGLAISKSIVEAHGGEISASPNPGGGTTFCVRIPPAPAKSEAAA